ncbi:Ger(x)C family spore germination protein [Paenibacillus sp. LMG 31458]|uniref:Ger(X)C family spore germination protein n=1 Tax=Paenibacillus phytorum TaxID=2654977 RepID=A0ABX1XXU2_9BACL|nr:Ger(x)C family spore germination protein [Paenibacillus phytorum]NOU73104.1 Ger(x)C family spore germination protein [Paenibacillus phytorum]
MSNRLIHVISIVMVLCLTGCWDRKEINDIAIMQLSALDLDPFTGGYKGYLQVAIPKTIGAGQASAGGGSKQKTYMSVVSSGTDIESIVTQLERKLSRDVLLSHRRILIVGDTLASKNLAPLMDYITRNPKNRLRTYLVIARDTDAKSLAETSYSLEATKEEAMREIIARKMKIPTMLRDFFASSAAPGIEPIAAAFSKDKKDDKIILDSIALFKNHALVGYVDGNEAVALSTILGNEPNGDVKVRISDQKGSLSVRIDKLTVHKKVKVVQDQPQFMLVISASGHIMDNRTTVDISNPTHINELNESFEQEITNMYQKLLITLQKTYKTDSIGLGHTLYQKYPKIWKKSEKNWDTLFPEQEVRLEVSANIPQMGALGAPYYLKEEELTD